MMLQRVNSITDDNLLIQAAIRCLEKNCRYEPVSLSSPTNVSDYLRLKLGNALNEIFGVLFLDSKLHLIAFEELFYGSVNHTTVHPRVVIQKVLAHNAANVILVHNHPSGDVNPSEADKAMTQRLESLLSEIDTQVIDHIIVHSDEFFSFKEAGLL